jgi:hypothetical protein
VSSRLKLLLAWCVASALGTYAGCSLVDLSSRIHQDGCKVDAECEILNDPQDLAFNRCRPFHCSERQLCESAPLDSDHDGFAAESCEADPLKRDCNDVDPAIHPGVAESCNERDDDCDARIDEGVLTSAQTVAIDFGTVSPASDIVYAIDTVRTRMALGYAIGTSPEVVAANVIDYEEVTPQAPMQLEFSPPRSGPLHAAAAAVGILPSRATLAAAYLSDEPMRLVVGSLDNARPSFSAGAVGVYGLACAADEACAANSGRPTVPLSAPFSEAPAIAPGADGVLVAYVRNPDRTADLCEQGNPPAAKSVLANLIASAATGVAERTPAAVQLGTSTEGRAPALLGLPGLTTNGQPYGWLVAYPDVGGKLLICQVLASGGSLEVSAPLLKLTSKAGPLRAPQLAFGRNSAERSSIGLAAVQGCGALSRVVMIQLEATHGSDGKVTLRTLSALAELGGEDDQRGAALAYNEARHSWGVSYRDASGVRARVVAEGGALTGDSPYLLMDAAMSSQPAQSTAIAALRSGHNWFAIFAYADATETAPAGLLRTTLSSCTPP